MSVQAHSIKQTEYQTILKQYIKQTEYQMILKQYIKQTEYQTILMKPVTKYQYRLQRDKESRVCYECGKPGHLAKDCFSKKKGKGKQSPKKAAVNIAECDGSESETTEVWINSTSMPTGSTEPISSYKTQLLGIKPSTVLEGRIRIA